MVLNAENLGPRGHVSRLALAELAQIVVRQLARFHEFQRGLLPHKQNHIVSEYTRLLEHMYSTRIAEHS